MVNWAKYKKIAGQEAERERIKKAVAAHRGRKRVTGGNGNGQVTESNAATPTPAPTPAPKAERAVAARARPGLGEVEDYWLKAELKGSPRAFFDHFEANGWRTRTGPLRVWEAAARTWSRREPTFTSPASTRRAESPAQREQRIQLTVGKD